MMKKILYILLLFVVFNFEIFATMTPSCTKVVPLIPGTGTCTALSTQYCYNVNDQISSFLNVDVTTTGNHQVQVRLVRPDNSVYNGQIFPWSGNGAVWQWNWSAPFTDPTTQTGKFTMQFWGNENNTGWILLDKIEIYAHNTDQQQDFDALMVLYNSTNGPSWTNKTGWVDGASGTNCDYCNWYGVMCNLQGRVINLNLYQNNLSGNFPQSVNILSDLTYLNFRKNNLLGPIPNSISSLSLLEVLDLTENPLGGNIPNTIGLLSSLSTLGLSKASLVGAIPVELGQLSLLDGLYLGDNFLNGNIPSQIGSLSQLRFLHLDNNNLNGLIPNEIGNLSNLDLLDFSNNSLEGCIPISLQNLCLQFVSGNISNIPLLVTQSWTNFCNSQEGMCSSCPTEYTITYPADVCDNGNFDFLVTHNGSPTYNYTITIMEGPISYGSVIGTGTSFTIPNNISIPPGTHNFIIELSDGSNSCPDIIRSSGSTGDMVSHGGTTNIVIPSTPVCVGDNAEIIINIFPSPFNNPPYNVTLNVDTPSGGFFTLNQVSSNNTIVFPLNVLEVGNYGFSSGLTDGNGCTWTSVFVLTNLTVNPLPTASISGDLNICSGESTLLTAAGGTTFVWDPFDTSPSINVTPLSTTTYSVTVTDGNGCTDNHEIVVGVTPAPMQDLSAQTYLTTCAFNGNNEGIFDLTSLSDALFLDFPYVNYYKTQSDNSIITSPTAYKASNNVTIYARGEILVGGNICASEFVPISLIVYPYINITSCTDGMVVISENSSVYNVSWTGPSSGSASTVNNDYRIQGLQEGSYIVTVTDESGCTALCNFTILPSVCNHPDITSLRNFFTSTNGQNWFNKTGWSDINNCDPCTWFGISCTGNSRVSHINLQNNNLSGPVTLLTGLDSIVFLDLSYNDLRNGNWNFDNKKLKSINILGNKRLRSTIPDFDLPLLEELNCQQDSIMGSLPTFAKVPNLRNFFAYENQLSGTIPAWILPKLQYLSLANNQLTGNLPELPTSTKLHQVWLNNNNFSENIPTYLTSDTLQFLNVSYNNLSGCIDTARYCPFGTNFLAIGNPLMAYQGDMDMICNNMQERAPFGVTLQDSVIMNCQCLPIINDGCTIRITNNYNVDITVDSIILSEVADNYNVSCNYSLSSTSLDTIYHLDSCNLSTRFVNIFDSTGIVVGSFGLIVSDTTNICTAPCQHPDYAALMALYNSTNGQNWTNNGTKSNPQNTTAGWAKDCAVCDWYGVTCDSSGRVVSISLSDNKLNGKIPNLIDQLSFLEVLQLNQNFLTGGLPDNLCNLFNLKNLHLTNNPTLGGSIPNCINQLKNLEYLTLAICGLTGNLPASVGSLDKLISLSLFQNSLSGPIPSEIGDLTKLSSLRLNDNKFNGVIPFQLGNLPNLVTRFHVQNNLLEGCIPFNLHKLCSTSEGDISGNTNLSNQSWSSFCSNNNAGVCTCSGGISGPENICEGGILQLNAGSGFDTYIWNNGSTSQTIPINNVSAATTYSVTVTTSLCRSVFTKSVNILSSPVATITGPDSFCIGSNFQLSSNAANQYAWLTSNGQQLYQQNININLPGLYQLTVTDTNGCTASTSKNITSIAPPQVNIWSASKTVAKGTATIDLAEYVTSNNQIIWTFNNQSIPNNLNISSWTVGEYIFNYNIIATSPCTDITGSVKLIISDDPLCACFDANPILFDTIKYGDKDVKCVADIPNLENLIYRNNPNTICSVDSTVGGIRNQVNYSQSTGGIIIDTWVIKIGNCLDQVITRKINVSPQQLGQIKNLPSIPDTINCDKITQYAKKATYIDICDSIPIDSAYNIVSFGSICYDSIYYTWEYKPTWSSTTLRSQIGSVIRYNQDFVLEPFPKDTVVSNGASFISNPIVLSAKNNGSGVCFKSYNVQPTYLEIKGECEDIILFTWNFTNPCNQKTISDTQRVKVFKEPIVRAFDDTIEIEGGKINDINILKNDSLPSDFVVEIIYIKNDLFVSQSLDEDGDFTFLINERFFEPVEFIYEVCDINCNICDTATVFIYDQSLRKVTKTNIITPDGSINNTLRFTEEDIIPNSELFIYNRWGDKVFHTKDYANDWNADGFPGGVYFYVFILEGAVLKRVLTVVK